MAAAVFHAHGLTVTELEDAHGLLEGFVHRFDVVDSLLKNIAPLLHSCSGWDCSVQGSHLHSQEQWQVKL